VKMMKTLLLGAAAGLVAIAGAQAAEMSSPKADQVAGYTHVAAMKGLCAPATAKHAVDSVKTVRTHDDAAYGAVPSSEKHKAKSASALGADSYNPLTSPTFVSAAADSNLGARSLTEFGS
jgi:hypothetical protein